jgi:hypothetical protein
MSVRIVNIHSRTPRELHFSIIHHAFMFAKHSTCNSTHIRNSNVAFDNHMRQSVASEVRSTTYYWIEARSRSTTAASLLVQVIWTCISPTSYSRKFSRDFFQNEISAKIRLSFSFPSVGKTVGITKPVTGGSIPRSRQRVRPGLLSIFRCSG